MGDNSDSVLHAEVLGAVGVGGLGGDLDVSAEEGLDDEGDAGQDEGLGAVGVLVAVEAGVEGKAAGLSLGGELLAVLGGDQGQEVLGVVAAGANVDGEAWDLKGGTHMLKPWRSFP